MHTLLRTSIVTLLLTAPAWAANPTVGQEAPELGSANWVLNEPGQTSIAALRGEGSPRSPKSRWSCSICGIRATQGGHFTPHFSTRS